MGTFRDVGTSAAINLLSAFLFLLAFSILRLQPKNARVYFPKWYIKGVRKSSNNVTKERSIRKSVSRYVNTDYRAYMKMLSWMWVALRMPESELIDHAGLDSAVFLRIFLLGLKIFVPLAGVGFTLLIPVNFTDDNLRLSNDGDSYSEIDKLSIANVKSKSSRLWTHLLASYIFTVWTCIILYMEFRTVAEMRLHHLATRKRAPNQYTVHVRQVPPVPEKTVAEEVEDFFRLNHPEYLQTQVVYNANKLANILQQKATMENWILYYDIKYEKNPKKRPRMKTGFCGLWGKNVDAIDYYTEKVEKLNEKAQAEQEEVLNNSKSIMPAAFVSFKSTWAAAVCAQTQQTRNPTKWITQWAPEPRDVYWPNLAIPYFSLTMRMVVMTGALMMLIIFFMIPVTAVQSLANLDAIAKRFKFLAPIVEQTYVKGILQGFLPGLALKIFLAILPTVLMLMSKFEGHLSRSELDRITAAKLFYFMVVNVFFGSVISGSLFGQIKAIFNSQSLSNILALLGNTIPTKATFFITYIMVDGWSGVSLEITRLVPLILYHLKNVSIVRTPRDRDRAMAPGTLLLDQNIPRLELYLLLGIVYSVITPLIMPFIIIFFSFGYVAFRNQVINVYDPDYDSAAAFWPHVHARIISAMIINQLTLIGLFTIKGPIGFVKEDNLKGTRHKALAYLRWVLSSTPFMALLPIGTLIFHYYCRKRFFAAFQNYPLEDANAKDRQEKKDFPNLVLKDYLHNAYLHPVLREEEEIILREKAKSVHGKGVDVEEGQSKLEEHHQNDVIHEDAKPSQCSGHLQIGDINEHQNSDLFSEEYYDLSSPESETRPSTPSMTRTESSGHNG